MQPMPGQSAGYAARKLRLSVVICCWVLGLSLITQVVGWSLATFTDLRYETVEPKFDLPLVVTADHGSRKKLATSTAISFEDVLEPVPVRTSYDRFFNDMTSVSMATGTLSILVLLPLILVSVMLIASRATGRVHHTISALIWTAIVASLALPLQGVLDLPWQDGAFHSYEHMVRDIAANQNNTLGTTSFYGRYLVLPMFCAVGALMIGWRFGRGVELLIPAELPTHVDPELEKEAANIKASTLHGGGRAGAALNQSVAETTKKQTVLQPKPQGPNARSISPGNPLERPKF